jgi:long-subunit acyl-CoA synthetase (AMP-forming)
VGKPAFAGNASAPLPPELLTWYPKLVLNLMEGYAMSEDFAYSHAFTKEKNFRAASAWPPPVCRCASARRVRC